MVIKGTLRLMGPCGNDPVVQRLVYLSLVFTVALYFYRVLSPLRYEFSKTGCIGFFCTVDFCISHLRECPHL